MRDIIELRVLNYNTFQYNEYSMFKQNDSTVTTRENSTQI